MDESAQRTELPEGELPEDTPRDEAPAPHPEPSPPDVARLLATDVQFLPGVGARRADVLARLDLRTARDVLFYFPRTYEHLEAVVPGAELKEGQTASVIGVVEECELRESGGGRSVLGVLVFDERRVAYRGVWFNQGYLAARFRRGQRLLLTGTVRRRGMTWEMPHPRVEHLDTPVEGAPPPPGISRVLPVYSLTEGLKQHQIRRITAGAVERFADLLEDVLPTAFRQQRDLVSIREALRGIHQPETAEQLERARRRLVYQELLILQLALAQRRWQQGARSRAVPLPVNAKLDARIRRLFPHTLTPDQDQAVLEMTADLARPFPMNRLLQGDVGTGKTLVAVYALLLAVAHGQQAALMAPTEVLARQHARVLERSLAESRVRTGLLTGSLTAAQRRDTLAAAAAGELDLVIGTHALANAVSSGEVAFARLALVIVDEQHKFGVRQRALLKQAGTDPHYLVMTATPIPRTVSMTLFGDLDVSTLRTGPPGRQRVHTYLGAESDRDKWWEFFCRKLREGRQGYVIAPVVDESEDQMSAEEAFEALSNGPLEAFRLGLVHGRLAAEEKDAAMRRFERGDTQVLVATSVVEVGIDVPNATLMTIEGGEKFGLAQLHQLRGRVRRGEHPGYVCVFARPGTDESRRRLEAFRSTDDGFALAELDFQLRGPGDLFGTRQHGLPPLYIADLQRDQELLETARRDARELFEADPGLRSPELAALRAQMVRRYGAALEISDVG